MRAGGTRLRDKPGALGEVLLSDSGVFSWSGVELDNWLPVPMEIDLACAQDCFSQRAGLIPQARSTWRVSLRSILFLPTRRDVAFHLRFLGKQHAHYCLPSSFPLLLILQNPV